MFKRLKQKWCKHKYKYVGTIEKMWSDGIMETEYYTKHVAFCPKCMHEIEGGESFIRNKVTMSEMYWREYLDRKREVF